MCVYPPTEVLYAKNFGSEGEGGDASAGLVRGNRLSVLLNSAMGVVARQVPSPTLPCPASFFRSELYLALYGLDLRPSRVHEVNVIILQSLPPSFVLRPCQAGGAFVDLDSIPDGAVDLATSVRFLLSDRAASLRAILVEEAAAAGDILLRQAAR